MSIQQNRHIQQMIFWGLSKGWLMKLVPGSSLHQIRIWRSLTCHSLCMVYLSGIFEPHAYYDLLNCILSCPHLAELRLAFCKINTKKKRELKFITTFSHDTVMPMDQSMDCILYGFPILEELTLWFCYAIEDWFCSIRI